MGTVAQGMAREKETHLVERADRSEEDDGRRCMREKPNEVSGRCRLKHSTSVLPRETKVEAIRVRPQSGHLALRARIAAGPASDPTYRPCVSDAPARARARDGGGRIGNGPTRSGQDEGTRGRDLTGEAEEAEEKVLTVVKVRHPRVSLSVATQKLRGEDRKRVSRGC